MKVNWKNLGENCVRAFFEILPHYVLGSVVFLGAVYILTFLYIHDLTFEEWVSFIKILVWPTIVFVGLLFFRRVFTYLFFSIEEFN